jgi:hypothetical protein
LTDFLFHPENFSFKHLLFCHLLLSSMSDGKCSMLNVQCSMFNVQCSIVPYRTVPEVFGCELRGVSAGLLKSSKWRGHPFSRSYGANVPSSLERFLSRALVYSTHPPVSVYGTGSLGNNGKLFSANCLVIRFARRLSSAFDCLVTFLFAHFQS